jgi:hypothetical protein
MFNRTRWSALGAAVAVTLAGGLAIPSAQATVSTGERLVYFPITPCRLLDTRPAPDTVGPRGTALAAHESYTQTVTGSNGNCTVPLDARAVALNVTVANGSANSYLTVWPADAAQPVASNLNWPAGSGPIPNKVDVGLSADGRISFYNNGGTVDVLADVVGYYADHNHDDRYYTKPQVDAAISLGAAVRTDTYAPYAMQSFQPVSSQFGPIGGVCITKTGADAGSPIYFVPVTLPVGARLVSVDVATYDGSGTAAETHLNKDTGSATGYSETTIASGIGGSGPPAVHHDILVPSPVEIVAANEAFSVQLTNMNNGNGNGFCGLTVTYDIGG